jgi:hypothetical protein
LKRRSCATFIAERPRLSPPTFSLLLQRFEEALHQFIRTQMLQFRQLFRGQVGEVLGVPQPLQHLLRDLVAQRAFYALEDPGEDAIVGVEIRFALDQAGTPEVVEAQQVRAVQSLLEGAQKRLPFLNGHRDTAVTESVEEVEKHGIYLA